MGAGWGRGVGLGVVVKRTASGPAHFQETNLLGPILGDPIV